MELVLDAIGERHRPRRAVLVDRHRQRQWLHGFDAQFGLVDAGQEPRPSAELAAGWAQGR